MTFKSTNQVLQWPWIKKYNSSLQCIYAEVAFRILHEPQSYELKPVLVLWKSTKWAWKSISYQSDFMIVLQEHTLATIELSSFSNIPGCSPCDEDRQSIQVPHDLRSWIVFVLSNPTPVPLLRLRRYRYLSIYPVISQENFSPLSAYRRHKTQDIVVYLDEQKPSHSHLQRGHQSAIIKEHQSSDSYNSLPRYTWILNINSPLNFGVDHLIQDKHTSESSAW